MKLGASGVQMGTRFVTTNECDASNGFKQAYINAAEKDIEIIMSPVGMPGRAIFSSFIQKVKEGKKQPKKRPKGKFYERFCFRRQQCIQGN